MPKSRCSEVRRVNQECDSMCILRALECRHLLFAALHRHALNSRSSELGTRPKLEKR